MPNAKVKGGDRLLMYSRAVAVLCILGTLVSIYLAREHFKASNEKSLCDIGATLSCSVVLNSQFAKMFSVPLGFFGITWHVVLLGLSIRLSQSGENRDTFIWATAHFIWTSIGLGFVFYLLLAEFILGALCPFCTIIHIITFIMFYLSWKIYKDQKGQPTLRTLFHTTKYWIIGIIVVHFFLLLFFNYSNINAPTFAEATLTSFCKCLTKKGIVMYGSHKCSFCIRQRETFGPAAEFINFVDCETTELVCAEKGIDGYPTWIKYEKHGKLELKRAAGILSLSELQVLSDNSCRLELNEKTNTVVFSDSEI